MQQKLIPILCFLVLILSACSNAAPKEQTQEMITYQSENGPIQVPANPKRVVVLGSFTGNVLALGVNLVGVDQFAKNSPYFQGELKGVTEVSDENLEKIIELNPDLIIGLANTKNVAKLKKIAPTVTFTYGKVDYLTQHIEIGKLLNKEAEARKWVQEFKKRAKAAGEKIKKKIGEDATVTVIESYQKQLYVYGNNWGRGTEILYQAMGLKMPEAVKKAALKPGYYAISPEVLSKFAGDYIIFSKYPNSDHSFQKTESYQNIPAVKNNHVFEINATGFLFNDPITLEHQLKFIKKSFLGGQS